MKNTNINTLGLFFISLILLSAFFFQIYLNEIPCPLCLLQRLAFVGVGIGLISNLNQSNKPVHFLIINTSALFGLFVSLRQIMLHSLPNDPGYGSDIFGMHMYTWSAIIFFIIILISSITFSLINFKDKSIRITYFGKIISLIFICIIIFNIITIFLVSGFHVYPENPTNYLI
jgi:disulfide bond formation protein DsbB